jgi:hypothetical protein
MLRSIIRAAKVQMIINKKFGAMDFIKCQGDKLMAFLSTMVHKILSKTPMPTILHDKT